MHESFPVPDQQTAGDARRLGDLPERERGPSDPQEYREAILPTLADVPLRVLVGATGLSATTCSLIRNGKKIPHARHWEALRKVGQERELSLR